MLNQVQLIGFTGAEPEIRQRRLAAETRRRQQRFERRGGLVFEDGEVGDGHIRRP